MFGHPGISALEYAGSVEATRKRNTSVTSESLKRKSTTSMQDENTKVPFSAGTTLPAESEFPSPVHFIDEFGCQQRRRGTFVNHTPRDFEMRTSKTVDVYRPSHASNENYSRPRASLQANSISTGRASTSPHTYSSSEDSQFVESHAGEKRLTVNPGAPIELDATEVSSPSSLEVYKPSTAMHHRSVSSIVTYQPSLTASAVHYGKEVNVRSVSNPSPRPQEQKRQRRQTPFKIAVPKVTNNARHAPLEPLVAEHRRKASTDDISDLLPQSDNGKVEEMGTFGVIQRYFDSQTGGPVVSPKILCHACSQDPPNIPLPSSPEPSIQRPFKEPISIYPIDELDLPDEPPAVPERSPKRLTNPAFPTHVKTAISISSDFAFAAEGQYSPYDKKDDVLHIPKKRAPKRLDVEEAPWIGSPNLGRMAPPILGHDALTASSDLGLNDLSYYLKHTGPSTDPQPAMKQRKTKSVKIFKAQQRKSLAARVGSVEGSPQRARKQTPVPACAREMITSGGARHLKIIIPTDRMSGNQMVARPVSQSGTQRRSRHISITFTDEMLNPLASPEVERMLSEFQTPNERSFTEPIARSPRSSKRRPKSPKRVPVPVIDDPLASREEQTRARKLRDLQHIKRKPLPSYTQMEQHPGAAGGALPTPAQTPEPINNPSVDGVHEDHDIDEDSPANKMTQLQSKMVLLQRQNTELTDALAKLVGLELEGGDLKSEDVLKAFRQIRISRTPGRE
ncbi:Nn.00g094580.m01.CDS01 [Neocucurbitaria sp. VM-36]